MTSLFEYLPGESTLTYTDERFPRVHRTLNDLTPNQQATARKSCEENGVSGDDMKGCIYDMAYLNIPGNPRPAIHDQTTGLTLGRIDGVVRNDNNGVVINSVKQERGEGTPQAQPLGQQQGVERNAQQEQKAVTPPTQETQERPAHEKPAQVPIQIINGGGKGSGTPTNTTPTRGGGGTTPVRTTPTIKPGKG